MSEAHEPTVRHRDSITRAQVAFLVVYIGYLLFGKLVSGRGLSPNFMFPFQLLSYVVLGAAGLWVFRKELGAGWRASRATPWRTLGWVALGFVGAHVLLIIASNVLFWLGVSPVGENVEATSRATEFAKGSAALTVLLILASSLCGPLVEEFVFRGTLIGKVPHRIPAWLCLVVSSTLFGAMHLHSFSEWPLILDYGSVGVLLGALYLVSNRSILVPIAVHVAWNGSGVALSMALG